MLIEQRNEMTKKKRKEKKESNEMAKVAIFWSIQWESAKFHTGLLFLFTRWKRIKKPVCFDSCGQDTNSPDGKNGLWGEGADKARIKTPG